VAVGFSGRDIVESLAVRRDGDEVCEVGFIKGRKNDADGLGILNATVVWCGSASFNGVIVIGILGTIPLNLRTSACAICKHHLPKRFA